MRRKEGEKGEGNEIGREKVWGERGIQYKVSKKSNRVKRVFL